MLQWWLLGYVFLLFYLTTRSHDFLLYFSLIFTSGASQRYQCVIYAILCTKCSSIYIGETGRRLGDRIREHLHSVRVNTVSNDIVILQYTSTLMAMLLMTCQFWLLSLFFISPKEDWLSLN